MAAARHHYIPRFHLRQFACNRDRGHVWRYDKRSDHYERVPIRRAAAEIGYYSVPPGDDHDAEILERAFNQLETQAAPIVRWLASRPPGWWGLGAQHRRYMADYLATLHLRGPAWRDASTSIATFSERVDADMLLNNPEEFARRARDAGWEQPEAELNATRLQWQEELRTGRLILEAPKQWSLLNLQMGEIVAPILMQRRWFIYLRSIRPWLILGDQPVVIHPPADHPEHMGASFGTPGVEIYCPLSPSALLLIADEPDNGVVTVLEPDDSHDFGGDWLYVPNRSAWGLSHQYVIGSRQPDLEMTALTFAEHERMSSPSIGVSGIPAEWRSMLPEWMKELEPLGSAAGES